MEMNSYTFSFFHHISSDEEKYENELQIVRDYGKRVQGPWVFKLYWLHSDGIFERRFLFNLNVI